VILVAVKRGRDANLSLAARNSIQTLFTSAALFRAGGGVGSGRTFTAAGVIADNGGSHDGGNREREADPRHP